MNIAINFLLVGRGRVGKQQIIFEIFFCQRGVVQPGLIDAADIVIGRRHNSGIQISAHWWSPAWTTAKGTEPHHRIAETGNNPSPFRGRWKYAGRIK